MLLRGVKGTWISSDQGVVDLEPGVLICADDYAWFVHVEE